MNNFCNNVFLLTIITLHNTFFFIQSIYIKNYIKYFYDRLYVDISY